MEILTYTLHVPNMMKLMSSSDIDECENYPCSQNCHNTLGSYTCSCRTGYSLLDETECVGKTTACMVIVFALECFFCYKLCMLILLFIHVIIPGEHWNVIFLLIVACNILRISYIIS